VIIIFLPRLSSRAAACASILDATILDVRKIASENPMIMITPILLTGFLLTFRAPRMTVSMRDHQLQKHIIIAAKCLQYSAIARPILAQSIHGKYGIF